MKELETEGRIVRARVEDNGGAWPGTWYVHADRLSLLDRLEAGEWEPRTTLLSPFDNLICDRDRTEQLFGFHFRTEIYVSKAKRQYGYYVLPILHGDRLIERIDPVMDRKRGRLTINATFAEPSTSKSLELARVVKGSVEELGRFLGANEVHYRGRVPDGWENVLC